MSNRFERESKRAGEERSSPSMMHLLGQMLMLPFTVFVYGMDMFVRTIKGMQRAADQGMDVMVGGDGPPRKFLTEENCWTDQMILRTSEGPQQGGQGDLNVPTTTSTGDNNVGDAGANKETIQMIDRNLSDDQLKLVRFKILFVKRDYEAAFREQEALVPDNMTGEAFTAWKVAEFIQELGRERTPVPIEWPRDERDEQRRPKYPKDQEYLVSREGNWYLRGFPEKDKKYLRVYYEVLDRYVREEEDDEVVVLKEIRDAIHAIPGVGGAGGGGGTAPAGAGAGAPAEPLAPTEGRRR